MSITRSVALASSLTTNSAMAAYEDGCMRDLDRPEQTAGSATHRLVEDDRVVRVKRKRVLYGDLAVSASSELVIEFQRHRLPRRTPFREVVPADLVEQHAFDQRRAFAREYAWAAQLGYHVSWFGDVRCHEPAQKVSLADNTPHDVDRPAPVTDDLDP